MRLFQLIRDFKEQSHRQIIVVDETTLYATLFTVVRAF